MKKRIIAILVTLLIILLLASNGSIILAQEIVEQVMSEKAEAFLDMEITKYQNVEKQEEKAVILQFKVKNRIQYPEGQEASEIEKSTTFIELPRINNVLPARVETLVRTSEIKDEKSYYEEEKGILQITANQVKKDIEPEYEIIAIYPKEAYTAELEDRTIEIKAIVQNEFNEEDKETITGKSVFSQVLTEPIGEVISSDIKTSPIYDGFIKSNQFNNTNYETNYKENIELQISYKDIVQDLQIQEENDLAEIIYKTSKISKQELINLLGEEGKIQIIAEDGTVLQEWNKDSQENEQGMLEITYPNDINTITWNISKPIKEGILNIQHNKTIPATVVDSNISKIKTIQTIKSQEEIINQQENIVEIQKSQSKMEIVLDKQELSNGITNSVNFTANLITNSNEYQLYQNPILQITIPAEVEKVILGESSILHGQGLSIASSKVIENRNGTKTIEIALEGTQKEYSLDSLYDGASIVIPANLILKQDLESTKTVIEANYRNEVRNENGKFVVEEKQCEAISVQMNNTMKNEEEKPKEDILNNDTEISKELTEISNEVNNKEDIALETYAQIGEKQLKDGDKIHTTEIIKYVVKVTNTTEKPIENVDIVCQIPENTVFATVEIGTYLQEDYSYKEQPEIKSYTFKADTLEPGETKTGFYEVVVKDLEEGITEKQIKNQVAVKVGQKGYKSQILENTIIPSKMKVYVRSYIGRDCEQSFRYYIDVTNTSKETLNNIQIETTPFQKEMNINDVYYYTDGGDEFELEPFGNYENGKLTGTMVPLEPGKTRSIALEVRTYNFDDQVNEVPLKMSVKAYTNQEDIYYSNENRRTAYPEYVTVKMTSDKEGKEVKAGEEVTYEITIKNESKIRTTAHITDNLSKELQGISLTYETYHISKREDGIEGTMYDIEEEANIAYQTEVIQKDLTQTIDGRPNIDEYLEIPAGKSVVMTIKAKTWDEIQTKEVSNYATATRLEEDQAEGIKTVTSNIVKFTLKAAYQDDENTTPGGGNQGGNEGGNGQSSGGQTITPYAITGMAWLDANRDGKRDNTEEVLNGIKVQLFDVETKSLIKETTTDSQGVYRFTELKNGNYWVLFEYESNQYSLTAYQKDGVSNYLNSDVITKQITIDGVKRTVAMTDTITISDNGIANIDMGLVKNSTFDLKLDKTIQEVKVQTNQGTKTYTYENAQFAKVEIKAKQIQNSKLTITYQMKITNTGDTEGFASKIIDTLPEDFNMDTSLNKGWVKESDGKISNETLSGELIGVGDSKVLTLVLTKQLTQDSTGSIVNQAEIGESKNATNLSDKDDKNNISKAELLISIETGILTYTLTTLGILGILSIIVIMIEKKTKFFKNKIWKNTLKMLLFIFSVMIVLSTEAQAFSVKYDSSGKHKGSDGNRYLCADAGWHLCGVNEHYYGSGGWAVGTRGPYTSTTNKKTVKITQNSNGVDTLALNDNYNLVGPYTIVSNCTESSITGITLNYTENGKVKSTNATNIITDKNGKSLGLSLTPNKNYTFYLKVGVNVEKINSIKMQINVKNVKLTTSTTYYKWKYPCNDVGAGKHHNGKGQVVYPKASKTQGMLTTWEYSSKTETYSSVTQTVTFGAVDIRGRIIINKTDDTTEQPLEKVGFTLKMIDGKKAGQYVSIDKNGNAVYQEEPATLITDKEGIIYIKLLYQGNYELIETVNPHYGYGETPITIESKLWIRAGGKTTVEATNRRKYVKLSGHVWEDIPWEEGKEEVTNSLYNDIEEDINDKSLENVTVTLKDMEGNVIPFKNEEGETIESTTTDSEGKYIIKDVEIDQLHNYYVEFTYNGMSYASVKPTLDKTNGNKAIEGQARIDFNNDYTTIIKDGTLDEEGNKAYDLNYNTENYQSHIIYGNEENLKKGYEEQKYPINGTDSNFLLTSTTQNAYNGGLDKIMSAEDIRENGAEEISNINLGLEERIQPDISLIKDLDTVKVNVNGAEHIYKYADRFNSDLYAQYDEEGRSGYDMDPQVKFGQKYGNMSYTRALYASDIHHTGENELSVQVTYRIGLRSNTSDIKAVINELTDYYDTKYELIKVGKEINSNGTIKENTEVAVENEKSEVENYQKIKIKSDLIVTEQEGSIYVQLQVIPEKIKEILGDNDEEVKLDNVVEISSYSIKDKENNAYAAIDIDSQPGNMIVNQKETYEDDTDQAPGLKLVLQEERKINGQVFEDMTQNELTTGKIRQGDGIYTDGEKGISGVEVKLVKADTEEVAKYYDGEKWVNATTTTGENGEYTFGGFLPDDYKIIYTWGDSKYKVQDYKSTVVDKKIYTEKQNQPQWYKDEFKKQYPEQEWNTVDEVEIRTSDAVDNYETRKQIDEQMKLITNANRKVIDNYEGEIEQKDGNKQQLITKMDSTTPTFRANLEYATTETNSRDEYLLEDGKIVMNGIYAVKKDEYKNSLKSIDFGITERARQVLELNKRIKSAKVTLADGSILINAQIDENGKLNDNVQHAVYVPKSAINGQLKFEVEDEIIQSAKLEIEYDLMVRNISELDYLNEEYYYYGKGHGENINELVTLNASQVIDYLDNNIIIDVSDNKNGEVVQDINQKMQWINQGLLENSESMKQLLKQTTRVLWTEKLSKELKPVGIENAETQIELSLKGYKLLSSSSSSDETVLENSAEIVKVEKTGGSTLITTPGNYLSGTTEGEYDDSSAETLVIVPPTGLSNNYIAYAILAVSSLGILISGITLIKKFVLK